MKFLVMLFVLFCGVAVYGQDCDGDGSAATPDCNGNMIDDVCDVQTGFSLDCNSNLIPDYCDLYVYGTSVDNSGNGVPDECDGVPLFTRGNLNGGSSFPIHDMGDVQAILDYLNGVSTPPCLDAADVNDDGAVDISDPVYLLLYLFSGGPPPPPPCLCGLDPTSDSVPCNSSGSGC